MSSPYPAYLITILIFEKSTRHEVLVNLSLVLDKAQRHEDVWRRGSRATHVLDLISALGGVEL
jgi:hypothetical protein